MPLVVLLLAAACGGSASGQGDPVVEVKGPRTGPRQAASQELEPLPTPTPAPPTPTPSPKPTPTPLPPPRGSAIRAAAGTQAGAPHSYCWSAQPGARGECFEHGTPSQGRALSVRSGEVVLLALDADRAPNDETIRAFKGSRSSYPSQRISPALETELTLDLEPGDWSLDLCATWHGHGEPICWLFRLSVTGDTAPSG